MNFADFFQQATAKDGQSGYQPFPYQQAFGEATPENCTLEGPTGVGKSGAVVIRWLHRHYQGLPVATRLVIVEPMRTLVTQLAEDARSWLANTGLGYPVFLLKGGHIDRGYLDHAKAPCIIVATLDQIVSRQLMRGYSCSRWSWPIHFALLHNDCEYFCDETQLHGPAYCTSIRLAKLRQRLGTAVRTTVTWSSATLDRRPLEKARMQLRQYNVGPEDYAHPVLGQKLCRPKPIQPLPNDDNLAAAVLELHQPGSLTLVIRNRVSDAAQIAEQLGKLLSEEKDSEPAQKPVPVLLLHSRFRDYERSKWQNLKRYRGIIVATQVVEAGVDLDARVLITDICPWSSFVQRLGRLGRNGTYPEALARWLPVTSWNQEALRPYSLEQCRFTQETAAQIKDAAIQKLLQIAPPSEAPIHQGPSEDELRELFNTEPLPARKDINIAHWIRDSQNQSVSVAWLSSPPEPGYIPSLPELCPVPFRQLQAFGGNGWKQTSKGWQPVDCSSIRAGEVVVLPTERGGYSSERGWTSNPADIPPVVPIEPVPKEDSRSRTLRPVSLAQHSQETRAQMSELVEAIPELYSCIDLLKTSALWHDVGKAHPQFGRAISGDAYPQQLLAKGPFRGRSAGRGPYERRGFRHEFASAVLARTAGLPFLAQYLIAAHHGRCRVDATPFEWELPAWEATQKGCVRGVAGGDLIPAFALAPGVAVEGGPLAFERGDFYEYWSDGFDELYSDRDIGPFRLAYLEMLVRNADALASKLHELSPSSPSPLPLPHPSRPS